MMFIMSTLLTGANGQLGITFQEEMTNQQFDYIAVGKDIVDIQHLIEVRDFCSKNEITAIINCGAYNNVDDSEKNWETAYSINSLGPRNLAIISNELNIPLIHFSSDYVFDGKKNHPYTILDQPNPLNKYGESKYLGEKFVKSLTNKHILVRTSWVFGMGSQNFIHKLLSWAKTHNQLRIASDEISAPTNTFDLVKASLDLLKGRLYGTYHITNEGLCSRFEWAEKILEHISWEGHLIKASKDDFNLAAMRPGYSKLSTFGLSESIGYNLPNWESATIRYLDKLDFKV